MQLRRSINHHIAAFKFTQHSFEQNKLDLMPYVTYNHGRHFSSARFD